MTSTEMQEALSDLGITLSTSSIRAKWAKGAPRQSAESFAKWLAIMATKRTAATDAAGAYAGVQIAGSARGTAISSIEEGNSLLLQLFRHRGACFWLPAAAVRNSMLLLIQKNRDFAPDEQEPTAISRMFDAASDAVIALGKMADCCREVDEVLLREGILADVEPWLAATETMEGMERLSLIASGAWREFVRLNDEMEAEQSQTKEEAAP